MAETRWWKYVERVIGGDNAQDAAKRAGFSKSNFTRWKQGANADPEFVVKLARAYNANVLEALVEAEFITEPEAGLKKVNLGKQEVLDQADPEELIDQLRDRLRRADFARLAHDAGKQISGANNVHALTREKQGGELDGPPDFSKMAARKSRKSGGETNVDE